MFPVNSILVPEKQNPPAGAARFVPYLVIFVAAIAYFGSYWHFWFNPHDEGGMACLVVSQLLGDAATAVPTLWL